MIYRQILAWGALTVALTATSACSTDIATLTSGLVADKATSCLEVAQTTSVAGFSSGLTLHWVRSGADAPSQGSDGSAGCAIAHGGQTGTQATSGVSSVAAVAPVTATAVMTK